MFMPKFGFVPFFGTATFGAGFSAFVGQPYTRERLGERAADDAGPKHLQTKLTRGQLEELVESLIPEVGGKILPISTVPQDRHRQ